VENCVSVSSIERDIKGKIIVERKKYPSAWKQLRVEIAGRRYPESHHYSDLIHFERSCKTFSSQVGTKWKNYLPESRKS